MKIICDCGAIHEFSDYNEDTNSKNMYDESIGATYNTIENMTFWKVDHKGLGIMCETCKKAIWIFI